MSAKKIDIEPFQVYTWFKRANQEKPLPGSVSAPPGNNTRAATVSALRFWKVQAGRRSRPDVFINPTFTQLSVTFCRVHTGAQGTPTSTPLKSYMWPGSI